MKQVIDAQQVEHAIYLFTRTLSGWCDQHKTATLVERLFSKRLMHKYKDYTLDDLMKHLHIEEETRIRDNRSKIRSIFYHLSTGGYDHKTKYGGHNKRNLGPKKHSFKKPSNQNPKSNSEIDEPCHVCGEIEHYVRECKDHKLGPVARAIEQVTNLVTNVTLGKIFMISSPT
uniref:Uncharacterized protein n=1 Tax=Lactuca sativa TaxID=4236 RepID=A0A9R1VUL8_LACSA|nr:hypothetical protein LSAT_V11C400163730 [Lactuca sativa]